MICSTLFFLMLAGRFPVLMFSFIMRTLVNFWGDSQKNNALKITIYFCHCMFMVNHEIIPYSCLANPVMCVMWFLLWILPPDPLGPFVCVCCGVCGGGLPKKQCLTLCHQTDNALEVPGKWMNTASVGEREEISRQSLLKWVKHRRGTAESPLRLFEWADSAAFLSWTQSQTRPPLLQRASYPSSRQSQWMSQSCQPQHYTERKRVVRCEVGHEMRDNQIM